MTAEERKEYLHGVFVAAMATEFPELGKELDFVLFLGNVVAGRPYTVREKDKWLRAMAIESHKKKYPGLHLAEPHVVMDIEDEFFMGYEVGWFIMMKTFQ